MAAHRKTRLARALRRNLTPAEQTLWRLLRDRRLAGFKFRRQHPFGPYVLDFFSPAARVVVELDGDSHTTAAGRARDRTRDDFLTRCGLLTLRFWNAEVADNTDGVLELVYNTCVGRAAAEATP
jgi:adenine-specific DNA-methyltransferase